MDDLDKLGPLKHLVGTWEGDGGLDVSYHHAEGAVGDTPFRERTTFSPFGPVDNGTQQLYGLDYRMAAWRGDEVDPFHTEIGYWLWDAAEQQVMRCFMVPRGTAVLAGGTADADATTFTMVGEQGSATDGVIENRYLADKASCVRYECTITIDGPDQWSYTQTTVLRMPQFPDLYDHTDANTLRRIVG